MTEIKVNDISIFLTGTTVRFLLLYDSQEKADSMNLDIGRYDEVNLKVVKDEHENCSFVLEVSDITGLVEVPVQNVDSEIIWLVNYNPLLEKLTVGTSTFILAGVKNGNAFSWETNNDKAISLK